MPNDSSLIIQALFLLSRQIHSCEHKLNKLLEKHGEDAQLLHLTEVLDESSDALRDAMQPQPTQKETKNA